MLTERILLASYAIAVAATTFAACGGTAIVDGQNDGSGGDGGAGGATSSPTTTVTTDATVTSSSMQSSSTGVPSMLCEAACSTLADCGGPPFDCVARCDAQDPLCDESHQAWLSCSLGETNTLCGFGPGSVCGPDLFEFLDCTNNGVLFTEICGINPNGMCSCSASGDAFYEQFCEEFGGCTCFINAELVGFCEPEDTVCGITTGCCAGLFFTTGLP